MYRFFFLFFLFQSIHGHCQINPSSADSLARQIAREQKAIHRYQDSFIKVQESTYRSKVARGLQTDSNHYSGLNAQENKEEHSRSGQLFILSGILALLVLLVIGLLRHKKRKRS